MAKKIIYQVLPRLFGNMNSTRKHGGGIEENGSGKFNDFDSRVLEFFKGLGVTHIWYTGIIEHATVTDYSKYGIIKDNPQVVKGKAGSPYAIKDYYDVDPDLADYVPNRMAEFEALVDRTHKVGLKVIIDFVPNHLARQYYSDAKPAGIDDFGVDDDQGKAFDVNNNFYYLPGEEFVAPAHSDDPWEEMPARATGNDCFLSAPSLHDWYETVKLNYGVDIMSDRVGYFDPVPDTWHKMKSVLLYWCGKGVDGFRCDMAEMVPVEFWCWCIKEIKAMFPEIVFVAEVYQPLLYKTYIEQGGFDWLYDKVGFYDGLIDVLRGNKPSGVIAENWHKIDAFAPNMLFFLENHDEQRLASDFMFGNGRKAWSAWVITAAYSSNPVMMCCGQEIGERGMDEEGFSGKDGRTTIFDYWSVESLRRYMKSIRGEPSSLNDDEKWQLSRYKRLNELLHHYPALAEGGVYDLMWCNAGLVEQKIYAWLRFCKYQWMLLVANLSDKSHDCRIVIPGYAFKMIGRDHYNYFKGTELLENARSIQFPKEVAMANGVGVQVAARQALVYVFE